MGRDRLKKHYGLVFRSRGMKSGFAAVSGDDSRVLVAHALVSILVGFSAQLHAVAREFAAAQIDGSDRDGISRGGLALLYFALRVIAARFALLVCGVRARRSTDTLMVARLATA